MALIFPARDAAKAFSKWLDDAVACGELFRIAKMKLPEQLEAVFSVSAIPQQGDKGADATITAGDTVVLLEAKRTPVKRRDPSTLKIPAAPPPPARPNGAKRDWAYLKATEASPRNLTIAVLDQAGRAISAAEVNSIVNRERESRSGSAAAYNSLQRLRIDGDIVGTTDAYGLTNRDLKGIIHDGWLWVPEKQLTDQDRSAIRRRAITLILRENGPLSGSNVTRALARCDWLGIQVTRDSAKGDLASMQLDGRVRQRDDKMWEVIDKV